ncbi:MULTISPECIES: DUF6680 family protein [Carnobacterium]|uniref:DUF6680 family protein n=1 Tax=Carnobacterium TaxID=2747 RepID=UPI00288F27C3|nr:MULTISPECIES: DUF6680 family protein [Carnobacterium]MDT1940461.1 hypothetical protein [Carnobacterium divergens]MDT1942899.1 hypothetical protein [Carnobacterium divergens]MDT1948705.1 hypothetical protein [Carnobacterium divergens]MDT1951186.1 hypothetical protein [Carnobacterium divergens]MDT1956244.1 hypothetical protein [Carnobacterium divergens]
MQQIIMVIGIISTIAVAVYSNQCKKLSERNKRKSEVLEKLMAYRNMTKSKEFKEVINSIPVIFYDSKKILDALKQFEFSVEKHSGNERDKFGILLEEMHINLGLDANIDVTYLTRYAKF